ncbi:CHAT domain-containing protein, partial [Microcoleus sp. AR_TQ3_B6]|uniref:CHAT domain-containing protein n=1 Tax=Microcoleus sp. AR_TQ3_B6 TaxID=3055284 RepID=UPI002FD4676D
GAQTNTQNQASVSNVSGAQTNTQNQASVSNVSGAQTNTQNQAPRLNAPIAPTNTQNQAQVSNSRTAQTNTQNPGQVSNSPAAQTNTQNPGQVSNSPAAQTNTQNPGQVSNWSIAETINQNLATVSNSRTAQTNTQNPAPVSNLAGAQTNTQNQAAVSNLPRGQTNAQNQVVAPAAGGINLAPIPTQNLPASTNPLLSPSLQPQNQISNSLPQGNSSLASPSIDPSNLPANVAAAIFRVEDRLTREFSDYLNLPPSITGIRTLADTQNTLHRVEQATGMKPALIYISFVPKDSTAPRSNNSSPLLKVEKQFQDSDELELIVIVPDIAPVRYRIAGTSRGEIIEAIEKFHAEVTNPVKRNTKSYLPVAQQLYQWIVAPLEAQLQAQGIQNLSFISDMGLRSIPMAALHDGKGFLIERYSVGSMPTLSLTDTGPANFKNTQVLAMGASQFVDMSPLPAVETEVATITPQQWPGKSFLNEAFTLANLKSQPQQQSYGTIHLATHAQFRPGEPSESFIQLWDTKLRLDQLRQMGWQNPQIEMLVLSACRTAVGDREAELGFGGLAVQAGVKSALATLWYVSDEGSLALMAEFYAQLKTAPIKTEALRQAQLAMLRREVRVEGGMLHTSFGNLPLPPKLANQGTQNFSHPYYWSGFRMIGNPW